VQRRRRERKGAKAQGRKGKAENAEEKKGTQRCKGARTQREGGEGRGEEGNAKVQRRKDAKGRRKIRRGEGGGMQEGRKSKGQGL
jgi:hypothetical protein